MSERKMTRVAKSKERAAGDKRALLSPEADVSEREGEGIRDRKMERLRERRVQELVWLR
jgi:hypothetical protein